MFEKEKFVECLVLKMDLEMDFKMDLEMDFRMDLENYGKNAQIEFLKSQSDLLPGWSWNSSLTARDRFPQEIWLKILGYLKILDLGKCAQVCKWMHGICLDRSLKYHDICEIYQDASTR